jgi:hypothetical protein
LDSAYPDFYLASMEYRDLEEPRKCFFMRLLRSEQGGEFLLVSIDPPVIGQPYGLGPRDIHQLILSPLFEDDSVAPISRWPLAVRVYRLLSDPLGPGAIARSDVEQIAWAKIFQTERDARQQQM